MRKIDAKRACMSSTILVEYEYNPLEEVDIETFQKNSPHINDA